MRIESFPEAETPAALRSQVRALHRQAWPGPDSEEGHDPALRPVTMLLTSDGIVLSALAILSKEIEHAGQRFAASGLSTVVTDTGQRGHGYGYGRTLVVAARETLAAGQQDLAVFTCDRALAPFYQGAGWQLLAGTVLVGGTAAEPFPSDQFDKLTLGEFFSARAIAAADTFYGARIALHPGLRDRLW
ncbi:MAG: GNAT family N-acetyltransferase [Actinomycetota bacterium]|nr:GNAT family N-acetyltransferase [Actinomycetota bacterium]MDQ2955829.1 GNAT family N-acetyltransferase [Actinomycetota bacterium]